MQKKHRERPEVLRLIPLRQSQVLLLQKKPRERPEALRLEALSAEALSPESLLPAQEQSWRPVPQQELLSQALQPLELTRLLRQRPRSWRQSPRREASSPE